MRGRPLLKNMAVVVANLIVKGRASGTAAPCARQAAGPPWLPDDHEAWANCLAVVWQRQNGELVAGVVAKARGT